MKAAHIRYSSRMRTVFAITCLLLSLTAVKSIRAEQMPQISGETLADHSIEFPFATAGSVTIVFVGFSHASQSQLKAWTDRATNQFHNNPHVAIYSIAVLEDALVLTNALRLPCCTIPPSTDPPLLS